jgi:hypothetical protein
VYRYDPDRPVFAEQSQLAKGRFSPVNIWYPGGLIGKIDLPGLYRSDFQELDKSGNAPFADSAAGRFAKWHSLKREVKPTYSATKVNMPILHLHNAENAAMRKRVEVNHPGLFIPGQITIVNERFFTKNFL